MLRESEEVEVDVTWEDQARINTFGRLNLVAAELREEIARRDKMIAALQDAASELILADEDDADAVTYHVGETFVQMSREDVEARLAAQEEKLKGEVADLKRQVGSIAAEMAQLKALLYGKFKSSINLETDEV